jgi:hypothetical protein
MSRPVVLNDRNAAAHNRLINTVGHPTLFRLFHSFLKTLFDFNLTCLVVFLDFVADKVDILSI